MGYPPTPFKKKKKKKGKILIGAIWWLTGHCQVMLLGTAFVMEQNNKWELQEML